MTQAMYFCVIEMSEPDSRTIFRKTELSERVLSTPFFAVSLQELRFQYLMKSSTLIIAASKIVFKEKVRSACCGREWQEEERERQSRKAGFEWRAAGSAQFSHAGFESHHHFHCVACLLLLPATTRCFGLYLWKYRAYERKCCEETIELLAGFFVKG